MNLKPIAVIVICGLALETADAQVTYGDSRREITVGEDEINEHPASLPIDVAFERRLQQPAPSDAFSVHHSSMLVSRGGDSILASLSTNLLESSASVGCVSLYCDTPGGISYAQFVQFFRVEHATFATLNATLFATSTGWLDPLIFSHAGVRLIDQGGQQFVFNFRHAGTEHGPAPLDFFSLITLDPGEYRLEIFAANNNVRCTECIGPGESLYAESWAEVDLRFSPVPLPAAAWLLLSGLAGCGAIRRRFSG